MVGRSRADGKPSDDAGKDRSPPRATTTLRFLAQPRIVGAVVGCEAKFGSEPLAVERLGRVTYTPDTHPPEGRGLMACVNASSAGPRRRSARAAHGRTRGMTPNSLANLPWGPSSLESLGKEEWLSRGESGEASGIETPRGARAPPRYSSSRRSRIPTAPRTRSGVKR